MPSGSRNRSVAGMNNRNNSNKKSGIGRNKSYGRGIIDFK
jgi:hypothetical protein